MASPNEMEIERDRWQIPEDEPNLDSMAQKVHNLFKLKILYNQMDFAVGQHLAITKAIIELTNSSGGSGFLILTTASFKVISP